MITKKEARDNIRIIRNSMTEEECTKKGQRISEIIAGIKEFKDAKFLYLYNPIRNEVPTVYLENQAFKQGKITAYPKVMGEDMCFYRITDDKDVSYGYMNIREPIPDDSRLLDTDEGIIIMPGLAFDKKCNRAGYGKGFYDRFLENHKKLIKIGLAYEFQVVEALETDEWDIPLDYIVTEKGIYKG